MKRVTITDVAKAAHTSIATVSRVLNHTDYPVSPEMRDRILRTARAMDYTPNFFGRSLKSGRSSDIGVIVPSLLNPFYSEVIAGVEKECRRRGFNPIFCSSGHRPKKEREYVGLLERKRVEGMLISTINEDPRFLRQVMARNPHVVLIDQTVPDYPGDSVTFDFARAGAMAARYLIRAGHRAVAFLGEPFDRFSRRTVFRGFCEAMTEAGAPFRGERLFVSAEGDDAADAGIDEFANGRRLARAFLARRGGATAIVAVNDITAFGVLHELAAEGIRVPEDVSVIGFDNIIFSAMLTPPLTTVAQPSFEMGRLAAGMLLEKIRQERPDRSRIVLRPEIVERGSVRKLR